MIKVISHTTEERYKIMSEKWEQYRDLYYNTDMTTEQILKKLEITLRSEAYNYIKSELKKEKISPSKRAKLIQYGRWLS